jgi:spore cortex formation protein SpoVR/YcgB (stage V sporulation)
MFKETGADTILKRMATWADRFSQLANDPEFGIERLEYTCDAALVIEDYCRDNQRKVPDELLRKRLQSELRRMQEARDKDAGSFDAQILDKRIELLKARLKRDPINRVRDIGAFILDPKQNPGLSDQEREIITIVFEVAKYFHPQGRTKFMNESFASWCHKKIPQDPQFCLPPNWWMELNFKFWNMFETNPTAKYDNPYTIGVTLLEQQEAKFCPVNGEIEVPMPIFEKLENPNSEINRRRAIDTGLKQGAPDYVPHPDKSREMLDEEGNVLRFTGKWRLAKIPYQDLGRIFQIIADYRDFTFFLEFLNHDSIQELNDKSLAWIKDRFRQINSNLAGNGWNAALLARPIPSTLDGKLQKVMEWRQAQQIAEAAHSQTGAPRFPALEIELKWMTEVLLLIKAYQANRKIWLEMQVAKLTISRSPDISVIDGGVDSANGRTLVLEHLFDPLTGPLKPSWARESLKLLPRIWKQGGVRILTTQTEVDEDTGEVTKAWGYRYEVDAKGNLTEGKT